MATTTGDHTLTYPNEGVKNWYASFQAFSQQITNHLDNLADVQINTIEDASDNELLKFSAAASAVNYIQIANAATSAAPVISAQGDDANIGITLTPKGTGALVLDGLSWPTADGTANQVLQTNGSGVLSFATVATGVIADTTPQLGGALDVNGQEIVSISGADIDIHSDNNIIMELGDAAGADKVSIRDSAGAEVASINSDGDIACTDITANSLSITTALGGTSVDINGTTAETAVATDDELLFYDATAGANRKAPMSSLSGLATGDWTLLSTTTASASATVDINLTSGYNQYRVIFYGVVPAIDNTDLYFRVQTSGGGFRSGATDYEWASAGRISDATALTGNSTGDTKIELSDVSSSGLGNAAGEHGSGIISIYQPRSSSLLTSLMWNMNYVTAGNNIAYQEGGAKVTTAEDNDAVRFLMSSGNITSGTFKLYGRA